MVVGDEGTGMARDVEPGVIVDLPPGELCGLQVGSLEDRLHYALEHERAQLLDAGLGPEKQVEAALEHLLLGNMARGGIAICIGLALEEQCLELPVQPVARRQPRLSKGHRKRGIDA